MIGVGHLVHQRDDECGTIDRTHATYLTLTLGARANVLYHLAQARFAIGGGLDMPVAVVLPVNGTPGGASLWWPLLFGPVFEYRPITALALTLNLKFGPNLRSNGPGPTVVFAMQTVFGLQYAV